MFFYKKNNVDYNPFPPAAEQRGERSQTAGRPDRRAAPDHRGQAPLRRGEQEREHGQDAREAEGPREYQAGLEELLSREH